MGKRKTNKPLNAGQERYAYEQRMLARVRRGIPTEHPRPSETPREETTHAPAITTVGNAPETEETRERDLEFQRNFEEILADMSKRPGTAAENAPNAKRSIQPENNLEEGGEEAGPTAAGGAEGAAMMYTCPSGGIYASGGTRTFKKCHRFLTYGIANRVIPFTRLLPLPVDTTWYLTTGLARIPVEYPCLYMTPAEFGMLLPGERVLSLNVKVYQRNSRLAFETNASGTTLATLNQTKDVMVAEGLAYQSWQIDATYTFNAAEPMVPTAVNAPASFDSYVPKLYGATVGAGLSNVVPSSLVGTPMKVDNYACVAVTYPGVAEAGPRYGWPDLSPHIKRMDSTMASNQLIHEYNYEPQVGLLRAWEPFRHTSASETDGTVIETGAKQKIAGNAATYNVLNNRTILETEKELIDALTTNFGYDDIIEKSQYVHNPLHVSHPRKQASLHVGIAAVPTLNTLVTGAINSYTDVQGYFEIETEMVTGFMERSEFSNEFVRDAALIPQRKYTRVHEKHIEMQHNPVSIVNLGGITRMGLDTNKTARYMP
uniref:Structural protein 2 n=1 Tax=Tarsiger cyanurus ambidensovirus TaxID=2794449 RepID=A0A8A4XDN5_9VIRU|nr:MAG: structural protein 2 [Tarsiger cyanurus ambidensovirus]